MAFNLFCNLNRHFQQKIKNILTGIFNGRFRKQMGQSTHETLWVLEGSRGGRDTPAFITPTSPTLCVQKGREAEKEGQQIGKE